MAATSTMQNPSGVSGQGPPVVIENASQVYIARNIIESHVHAAADEGYNDFQDAEDNGTEAELGCKPHQLSRGTQTSAFMYSGCDQTVRICDNYTRVDLRINEKAAQYLASSGYRTEHIESEVLKCLARFEWNGDKIYTSAMTAWKLEMNESMGQLLKDVIDIIRNQPNHHKVCRLIQEVFQQFKMRLVGIDNGCIVFIFQHSSLEEASHMMSSVEAQKLTQKILLRFLPDWVREDAVSWSVMWCRAPPDQMADCDLSEPIQLIYQQSGNVASMDGRLMEHMVQKTLDRYISAFQQQIPNILKDAFQEYAKKQTEAVHDTMQSLWAQFKTELAVDVQSVLPSLLLETSETLPIQGDTSGDHKSSAQDQSMPSGGGKVETDNRDSITHEKSSPLYDVHKPNFTSESKNTRSDTDTGPPSPFSPNFTAIAAHVELDRDIQSTSLPNKDPRNQPTVVPGQKQSLSSEDLTQKPAVQGISHPDVRTQQKPCFQSPDEGFLPIQEKYMQVSRDGSTTKVVKRIGKESSSEGEESCERKRHKSKSGDESSGDERRTPDSPKKSPVSKQIEAEHLLNWVNVKSKASQSKDPEIQRMMAQVEHALQDEEKQSPRARALDTVLVLDTSDSVVRDHLDELKTVVHTFIDSIEENVDSMNLEENLAVVQVGGRAWVRQHLTNDYNRVRDAVDAMTPSSKMMCTGGRTPLFQALVVCLGAIEGRGGVVNVAGCHRVRPRLIFFTDGRPTDEAMEFGTDTQSNVNEVKFALVQLISEFASKKHKTTPAPIFWVPVGSDPDRPFLDSLAALSGGKVVDMDNVEELCRYYKIQETIGCVFKMVRKHKDIYETEQHSMSIVNALAGNLSEAEKKLIIEEVKKKQKEPESESDDADDFDNVFEDTELVEAGLLLPLGTRVRRGEDWKWNNQDTEGPGTVIQHRKKRDGWLHVMWDNGTHNAYRYGDGECHDVKRTDDDPRILDGSELIEIGIQVERGDDWRSGDEDGHGIGIVIRKRKDGKVKVRWENGHIGKYKYGADGKMELMIATKAVELMKAAQKMKAATAPHPEPSAMGATGGFGPAEGRRVWQWWDHESKDWRTYSSEIQDKLLLAYSQRPDGSCIISRDGKNRRILFKFNKEKTVDRGMMLEVKTQDVSEEQYVKMLEEEEMR